MLVGGHQPNNPLVIHNQAVSFYLAGHRCSLEIPTGPKTVQCLPIPAVANFVFSIELFLKSILVKSKNNKKGHKIRDLVNACPTEIISQIRIEYEKSRKEPSFDKIIDIVNDMFVKARYLYEYDVNIMYESAIIVLARSSYVVCDKLHKK